MKRLAILLILLWIVLAQCGSLDAGIQAKIRLTPPHIAYTAPEIANPGRGLYRWRGQTVICPPELKSDRDAFDRWTWAKIEVSEGVYDWSDVRRFVDEAAARGQRAWIGFGTAAGPPEYGPYVPEYLRQAAWGAEFEGDWYPNYNHPVVQARLVALLDSFVREFGDDERIMAVQMLSYGRFGEGYLPWNAPPEHPMWASESTAAWLVDAWHSRLSDKYLLSVALSNNPVFYYAMTKQPYWSWFRNALGSSEQMQNIDTLMGSDVVVNGVPLGPTLRERWKYVPILTETIGEAGDRDYSGQFRSALSQVLAYHVSLVGNGNFAEPYKDGPWNFWATGEGCPTQPSMWSEQNTADFIEAGKRAGYRYFPSQLSITRAAPGQPLTIETTWHNEGVAPIYEPWQVQLQLRTSDSARSLVWAGVSRVDLRTILPTQADQPVVITDTFGFPPTLPPGKYYVYLFIAPINQYVAPLQLAIEGQQPDGSYNLGEITVGCAINDPACP